MIIIETFERWRQPRSTIREKFAVTRHGLSQFPLAAPLLRPTLTCASSLVSNAAKLPRVGHPRWQRHQIQRHFRHIASHPAATTAGRDFATFSRKHKYP